MAKRVNKVILTNRRALKKKYGTGEAAVIKAVAKLVAADKQRGLTSQLFDLGSAATMRRFKGKPVTSPGSARQNKAAVDKLCDALMPDYVLLLGAIDVIPHQPLVNPVYSPGGDDDKTADSDLPYACQHGYSRQIEDFKGPTRVVGRLPDVTGASDPKYLLGLLQTAAGYASRPASDYAQCLGISAKVWKGSTGLSLKNVFGSSNDLKTSPADGPNWTAAQLKRRAHFINCHGAPADFHFYGQQAQNYPVAHDASLLDGKLSEGTVVAAECCYGAELFDPAPFGGQAGICNTCLGGKAYAFFGSSTIAYGPADGNSAADLITQYFLTHVLSGASIGRAALQARQDYVLKHAILDPIDLKTLAQFNLMGDPAVHPVVRQAPAVVATSKSMKAMGPTALERVAGLAMRRSALLQNGLALASAALNVAFDAKAKPSANIRQLLDNALSQAKASLVQSLSFTVAAPAAAPGMKAGPRAKSMPRPSPAGSTVHVAIGKMKGASQLPRLCAVLAQEQDGAVVVRRLFSR